MEIVILLLRQNLLNNKRRPTRPRTKCSHNGLSRRRKRVVLVLTCALCFFFFYGFRPLFLLLLLERALGTRQKRMTIIQKHIYDICNTTRAELSTTAEQPSGNGKYEGAHHKYTSSTTFGRTKGVGENKT